jgi:peptidase E
MFKAEGKIVLVGSGEFTQALEPLDRELVHKGCSVLVLTHASAPEGEEVQGGWVERARSHFARLGVEPDTPMAPCAVCLRAKLEHADLVWLSGGDPLFLTQVLWPLRDDIYARLRDGMVLAGSSAGAMALGAMTLPQLDCEPCWDPALDLVARAGLIPHFDEQDQHRIDTMLACAPDELSVIGIDANTWAVTGGDEVEVGGAGDIHLCRRPTTSESVAAL